MADVDAARMAEEEVRLAAAEGYEVRGQRWVPIKDDAVVKDLRNCRKLKGL